MKPIQRRPRLTRPTDALLPVALAAASALCPSGNAALALYVAWFAVACLSLFASRGVRIAFARQPAIRHVRGSVKCALLLSLAGGGLAAFALSLCRPALDFDALPLIAAGCLLNIEHIFYEYMYAIGDDRSATLSRGLTALFVLVGLLLYETGPARHPLRLVGMTGLATLVAAVISLVMGDGTKGRPDATVVRCAPRAALQTALYPAAALALSLILGIQSIGLPFFAGMILCELCKTPFRRSAMEAETFNQSLLIVCGAAGLLCLAATLVSNRLSGLNGLPIYLLSQLSAACAMVITAAICAFILFGNLPKRADAYE